MVDYTKDYKAGDVVDYYKQGSTDGKGPIVQQQQGGDGN